MLIESFILIQYSDEVLGCFVSFKLDDMKSTRKKRDSQYENNAQAFFSKYLTSEKVRS